MAKKRKSFIQKRNKIKPSKRKARLVKILEKKYKSLQNKSPDLNEDEIDKLFIASHLESKAEKIKKKKSRISKKSNNKKSRSEYTTFDDRKSNSVHAISGGAVSPR